MIVQVCKSFAQAACCDILLLAEHISSISSQKPLSAFFFISMVFALRGVGGGEGGLKASSKPRPPTAALGPGLPGP